MAGDSASDQRPFSLDWTESEFFQETRIVFGHVDELTERLLGHVRDQLEKESAAQEVSRDWIDAAYHILLEEVPDVDSSRLEDLAQARRRAILSLTGNLKKQKELLQPTADEIRTHAKELAQCVFSNWLGVVNRRYRHTISNGDSFVVLDDQGLPQGVGMEVLTRGVDSYAADPAIVTSIWQRYLEEKAGQRPTFPVSARLSVEKKSNEYRVVPSSVTADQVVEDLLIGVLNASIQRDDGKEPGVSSQELRAEVSAGRMAAAAITEAKPISDRPTVNFQTRKPELVQGMMEYVLKEYSDYLAQQHVEVDDASTSQTELKRQRDLLQIQFTEQMGNTSWSRAFRIVTAAIGYATAAVGNVVELEMDIEKSRLEQDSVGLGAKAIAPDETLINFAYAVADRAVKSHDGFMLKNQIESAVRDASRESSSPSD